MTCLSAKTNILQIISVVLIAVGQKCICPAFASSLSEEAGLQRYIFRVDPYA